MIIVMGCCMGIFDAYFPEPEEVAEEKEEAPAPEAPKVPPKPAKKKAPAKKKDAPKPKPKQKPKPAPPKPEPKKEYTPRNPVAKDDQKIRGLTVRAQEAQLMEQIHKADLAGYKVEKEKVGLEVQAGHLMETSLAEFIFLSYMEKANTDLLGMMKRLEPIVVNLVKEGDHKKLMKRIDKEIQSILVDIKKNQKHDVISWRRGLS